MKKVKITYRNVSGKDMLLEACVIDGKLFIDVIKVFKELGFRAVLDNEKNIIIKR